MSTEPTPTRYTLRDLPFPAKLVLTVFLLSVGLGYLSAMIQLHFKHATKGTAFPTVDDVVAKFSGQVPPWNPKPAVDAAPAKNNFKLVKVKIKNIIAERCVVCHGPDGGETPEFDNWDKLVKVLGDKPKGSEIYKLITAEDDAAWGKGSSMRQAFHRKGFIDGQEWDKAVKKKNIPPEEEQRIREERELERLGMVSWIEAGAPRKAYDEDSFSPPADQKPAEDPNDPVLKARRRQMSVEVLTQSTHAHMLSFSMLWALTGLVFAFTSYPLWMRVMVAPMVLVAQIADIACWWLARLPDSGPYFAAAIMGTGALVGLGLTLHIVLSLFNMYNAKGKVILAAMFLGAGVGMAILAPKVLDEVKAEKAAG